MNMAFIGAGKVGIAISIYMKKKGFIIDGYYSKSYNSAQKASRLTDSQAFISLKEVSAADIIWITTNDDAIEEVGKKLADLDCINEGHIIAHMSGVHGSSALDALRQKGCAVYSVHPLQAFADTNIAVEALERTIFTIEGSEKKLFAIKDIFKTTGNQYFIINEEGKTLYHAGACILSNYLVTLVDSALNLFEKAGIKRSKILDATMPLIMGTLDNIQKKDTKAALTGPIQRNDINTLYKHITEIDMRMPAELEFYKDIGLKTVQMIYDEKTKDQIEALNNVFKGGK